MGQALSLCNRHPLPEVGESIITTTFVVQSRIGSCGRFFNEPVLNKSLDRSIESARAETHFAFCSRGHLFHDAVTMQLPVSQGEENMEYRDGQWQQTLRISFRFFHVHSVFNSTK